MSVSPAAWAVVEPMLFGCFLVMMRMAGVLALLPGMTSGALPVPSRTLFVTFLTVFTASAIGVPLVPLPAGPVPLAVLVVREVVIGAAMGLVIRLLFAIADVSGAIAGMAIALSMAGMVDPSSGEQTTVISNVLTLAGLLLFVALGGHEQVVTGLVQNLRELPVGGRTLVSLDLQSMQTLGSGMLVAGLRIAAPIVIVTTLVNAGLGLMARAAPQVNIFAVGFSVLLIAGLLVLDTSVFALKQTMEERVPTLADEMSSFLSALE